MFIVHTMPRHWVYLKMGLPDAYAASLATRRHLIVSHGRRQLSTWVRRAHTSIRTIEGLAESLQIHPMTLIATAYCQDLELASFDEIIETVKADLQALTLG